MKKLISLILSVLLILLPLFSVSAIDAGKNSYPVIMIEGRDKDKPLYDAQGNKIFPLNIEKDYILDAVKDCLPYLGKGLVTGNLEPWAEKVAEYFVPLYKDIVPDENGYISDGSHPSNLNSGKDTELVGWGNGIEYCFKYDWRSDPYDIVDNLEGYIETIKEKCNTDKVSLVCRCYGAAIITAYLDKYGHDEIDTVIYYCALEKGCGLSAKSFSGNFEINPLAAQRYFDENDVIDDELLTELIRSSLHYLNSVYGLDLTLDMFTKLVNEKFYPALAPKILPDSLGAFTCFWAMCDDESYHKAKELIFGGQEEKYASFIDRIDRYHKAQTNLENMLTQYKNDGLKLGVIAKYNFQMAPLFKNNLAQSDQIVELNLASMGAVAADYGSVLSDEYVASRPAGYISPDHIVDASTCAFPECTWFIKNLTHSRFAGCADRMMADICKTDRQVTVDDFEQYPRFLIYNSNDTLSPLVCEKETEYKAREHNIFKTFDRFIKAVIAFIKSYLNKTEA